MSKNFFEVKNVDFKVGGKTKVANVSFAIENEGDIICLLGPSGIGKTTILRTIAGLEKIETGAIELKGNVLSSNQINVEPENRNIGFVFQDFALFPHLNIKQNIEFSENGNKELFNKLIDNLSLKNHLSKYPHELSGGQQQRASIARAIYSEPKILLIDEPISNQDKNNKIEIIKIISDFTKDKEIVCILVSHEEINNISQVETISYNLS